MQIFHLINALSLSHIFSLELINNNVKTVFVYYRISTMVEKLCTHYGEKICEYEGDTYYAFPEVEKLSSLGVRTAK